MVTYELIHRSGNKLLYQYWPEDDRSSRPGRIAIDINRETSSLEEPAERDFQDNATGADMNALRDAINDMRRERGEDSLTEEKLPAEPDNAVCRWWYYYDHVVQGLSRRLDKGERPEHGTVAWY
ncbi:MAG: hypothetical protein MR610_05400 [Olsenella sp.]|nr:hypothetical protein [Olsenella sp.]